MESVVLAGTIFGGLGLFLLAIGMMTDGLKLAAGTSLRKLLSHWSSTPLRGIYSGCFMTAVVQSSSAVTVASLGFVNAGLITMRQALGIIYGANIGTTMTGWLVALIGFNLNINAFALPMIGFGMLLKLIKQQGKAASFGIALVGFGLFFIGIDTLKGAFEGIVLTLDISKISAEGISGILLFLLVGIVMTVLTQSSSASIALTITAASSGMVGIYAAGAMVIGANIGTTSTALLAAIGATSNAKRVAAAQVIFNGATAIVALLLLPVLFYLIEVITNSLELSADPAISLALFHSVFNILGVLLVYPFNDRLAKFLEARFLSWEEKASHPQYLDKTIAQTPVLAVNALLLENLSVADKIAVLYGKSITPNSAHSHELIHELNVIKSLSSEVSRFIVNIQTEALGQDTIEDLATLMRIDQYFLSCAVSIERLAQQMQTRDYSASKSTDQHFIQYAERVQTLINISRSGESQNAESLATHFNQLQIEHDKFKAELIVEGTRAHISVAQMSESIDCLAEILRFVQQWFKALTRIHGLQLKLASSAAPATSEVDDLAAQ
ncbi:MULTISPECIES: Na/Pi cotransporter family protein [Aliiglaciecola]|uniref:Na/Pi cotransporter family protein n=1 Tax=Aliiglaciecola TaxID=1406885 RepID=UPI001C0A09B4|nr:MULTISPECIES: Na/Pi symporter [unclassified Aliiglaciecola]MBU2876722.1 Na/Pi symporter [Aliiglaciecola lipolytica]MDO6710314.1 Na/Pi symporter [Aliiglaciecola sp. 2_MG-2023]MDO6751462.1 Na/Pi symporter [Aliiglaciecola sp. 1_MG-2023]